MKISFILLLCIFCLHTTQVIAQDSCDVDLTPNIDKFTGEKTYCTSNSFDDAALYKIVNRSKKVYYLSLRAYGETAIAKRNGVYILFSDKTKLIKPTAVVECEVNSHGSSSYTYSTFITLTIQDVMILSKKTITDIKLYIFENEISERNARELKCGTVKLLKIN